MVPVLTDEIHDLDIKQVFSLGRAYKCTVRGIEGRLWLTQEGLKQDTILAPGDCFTIRTKGRVAMESLDGRARFAVSRRASGVASVGEVWRGLWARVFVKRQTFDCR